MTEPTIPQPRDDSGQFVSIATLFERERVAHERDHEQDRLNVRETAQRLEREVEETAQRLERAIEKETLRSAADIRVALLAVAETAKVHADAHNREHQSHERIHAVEKDQWDKEDLAYQREADALAASLAEYKESSNEWRGALRDQASNYVAREAFDRNVSRITDLEKSTVGRDVFDREHERLVTIEKKLAYYAGAAAVSGAAIALLIRLLGVGG